MTTFDTMDFLNPAGPRSGDPRTDYQKAYQERVDAAVRREAVLFEELLPVRLSDAEILDVARRSAELSRQSGQLEAEMKEAATAFKRRLQALEREHHALQDVVRSGVEHRYIQCEKTLHRDLGEVTITRLDTGRLVETRPMTPKERQTEMEL